METQQTSQNNLFPSEELKQVKVDNWGTFFLQRLQQLYSEEQFLDLKIVFPTNDIIIEAHRLVLLTFTEYFLKLEQQQKENTFNGTVTMPSDMPYECVKLIIRFMYTGQLEYWLSEQDNLYCTAKKMDMTVLTKLLDLELTSDSQITDMEKPCSTQQIIDVQESSTFVKPTISSIDLPLSLSKQLLEEESDRNFPTLKRKLDASSINSEARPVSTSIHKSEVTATSGPSRFDFPEADNSAVEIFSSFDDLTYDMKPFHQVSNVHKNKSYIRKCSLDKNSKNNMIQEDEKEMKSKKNLTDTNLGNERISKTVQQSQDKQFEKTYPCASPEEKENIKKPKLDLQPNNEGSGNNHANIVKEVLKKYPHLAKNNSNIRVKIMQKKANSSDSKTCTKTSYVLFKSEYLLHNNNNENLSRNDIDTSEKGPWKCNKCNLDKEYANYDMFRRHMYDAHEKKYLCSEKTCQYCDYKTKKQNYMTCHLYNEHKISLPKDVSFYKCHVCSYVAVTEMLLLSHMMKYNHRPTAESLARSSEKTQHSVRNESLKDESSTSKSHNHQPSTAQHHAPSPEEIHREHELPNSELSTHKSNDKHKSATNGEKMKFHRCKYCGESFRQLFNFSVHLDCVHKKLLKDKKKIIVSPLTSPAPPDDKSSTAEALSYDAEISLPAESNKNAHQIQHTVVVKEILDTYIIPDIELDMSQHNVKYNNVEDEPVILMVSSDNQVENYQEQSDIVDNAQLIMQDTNSSVTVYAPKEADHRSYQNYQPAQVTPDFEEVVEEVIEEVEEVEEFMEEEKIVTEVPESSIPENCIDNRIQEMIQYVEEQTEIVEYTNEKQQYLERNTDMNLGQESVMILKNMSRKRP